MQYTYVLCKKVEDASYPTVTIMSFGYLPEGEDPSTSLSNIDWNEEISYAIAFNVDATSSNPSAVTKYYIKNEEGKIEENPDLGKDYLEDFNSINTQIVNLVYKYHTYSILIPASIQSIISSANNLPIFVKKICAYFNVEFSKFSECDKGVEKVIDGFNTVANGINAILKYNAPLMNPTEMNVVTERSVEDPKIDM